MRSLDVSNNMLSQSLLNDQLSANNNELFNNTFNVLSNIETLNLANNGINSAACTTLRRSFNLFTQILLLNTLSCS